VEQYRWSRKLIHKIPTGKHGKVGGGTKMVKRHLECTRMIEACGIGYGNNKK
jgi:hypothetical protein